MPAPAPAALTMPSPELAASAAMIVPTYNERDNIRPLVEQLLATVPGMRVVIVDDNSPDGTGAVADDLVREYPLVAVVHRPGKLGLGTAYRDGFRRAIELGAEILLSMDADFSHKPEHISAMLETIREADMVIGSRYIPGGHTVDFSLDRRIISRGAQLFTHYLCGLSPKDCTSGFRCYRRAVLEKVDPGSIQSKGYSFLIEMLFRVEHEGFLVKESPITYVAREHGLSKISSKEILGAFFTVFRVRLRQLLG